MWNTSDLRSISETKHNPVGLLGMEAFQTAATQGREGMQRQGRNSQETLVQPWGRVLVLPQGICITISLSSFTELKPPTNGSR